jgi:hypothetical protein
VLAAPNAAAAAKKKPLAFAVATVRSAGLSADATRFEVTVPFEFVHPDSGFISAQELQMFVDLAPSTKAARAEIIKSVQRNVSLTLELAGEENVPPDRVAVALL